MNRRAFTKRTALTAAMGFRVARGAAPAPEEWRVAVIGHTGRGDYGHGLDTMWRTVPGCRVIGVADADPAGLRAASARLGGVPAFADYRALLAEGKPDLVAIAPRHIDQHHAMALAAAATPGVKGLYVEKPYCRTPQEADEIQAACARAGGVKLAVAHRNRYHPVLPVVRQLLASGEIGRILEVRGRGKEDHRSGALDAWVLGTHLFDLAAWLGGAPRACTALLYQDGQPCTRDHIRPGDEGVGPIAGNAVHARFELGDGTPFFFDSAPPKNEAVAAYGMQIVGTRGVIAFRVDREPLTFIRRGNPHDPQAESQPWLPITSGGIGQPEPVADLATRMASHRAAAEDLIDSIRHDRPPLCDAVAGGLTVEMVCAILESHRLGGARVSWPLTTRENPLTVAGR